MQYHKNSFFTKVFLLLPFLLAIAIIGMGQVSSVEYGKNRVQFNKFKWQFYQSPNFNAYFNKNDTELGKYVVQIAETELPLLEKFAEYSLQRRVNVIIYNNFNDMKQSNIGIGIDWQNSGGTTTLVNNKMVVYYNSNHADLKKQIREGIAKVLVQNLLFGDDLGEVAGNSLLDLPQWLVDGYVAYAGQNWSTQLDDEFKNLILSGNYKNFNALLAENPLLAGHAFWYYIEQSYKKENTTYLLYLARIYKSLNKATQEVTGKKKFKDVLANFMVFQEEKYLKDVVRRKNYPKGSTITTVPVGKRVDYFHFNVNPNKRDGTFAVVQYKKGQYNLVLSDGYNDKTLLKIGSKSRINEINPNYPIMAWDPLGNRLSVVYGEEGKLKLFVYDVISKTKPINRDLTATFDQVQDIKYLDNNKTLVVSAVKNGHSDIYTYDIENDKAKQLTKDVFDDLDPSVVHFRNKSGILFSSNRPSADAKGGDTSLLDNKFNIFLITDFATNKTELNQLTQLTNLKYGDARYPVPYDNDHFTFVSDENGIGNRYAGFFSTKREGLDTLVIIGEEILRNPSVNEVDSTLKALNKTDVDSIAVVSITSDSAYIFPITNYANSLLETREAGVNNQVSEVSRQGDFKTLYKLKINSDALSKRNISSRPTDYMKRVMELDRISQGQEVTRKPVTNEENVFQNIFTPEPKDSTEFKSKYTPRKDEYNVLEATKLFRYQPIKFSADYIVGGVNNNVLGTRFQKYTGGSGPISLTSNNGLNGMVRVGVSDLMEDIKFVGGVRISSNLRDKDWLFQFTNLRRRLDWGLLYYRNVQEIGFTDTLGNYAPGRLFSNLYQVNLSYPLDVTKSIRISGGIRTDNAAPRATDFGFLKAQNFKETYGLFHIEYVYDNTLNPVQNIWNGIRYKAYADVNSQLSKPLGNIGRYTYNFGFDARGYYPIYRNFIWAGRVAGDFSWGNQKLIYYLGGIDNWLILGNNQKVNADGSSKYRYFNPANRPAPDQDYAFQSLAVNMRGYIQNAANGNNAMVINSEFRLPVFSTLLNNPINNAFIRNFQLTQFVDLGTAWNGAYDNINRPSGTYTDPVNPAVTVKLKPGGIGPFLGGYGFGARSTVLGYFLKLDAGWPMSGFFRGKPIYYVSLGLDF
ncbi:MAG: hypothetical protein ABI266_07975 [Ginsengibacter sp.]